MVGGEQFIHADLVELGEEGEAVFERHLGFALDEGLGVADKLVVEADAVLVDPIAGEFFDAVGDVGQGGEAGFDGVAVGVAADEGDHLVGLPGDGGLDGGLAGEEGLVGVGLGTGVGGGALGHAELDGAGLEGGEVLLDEGLEVVAGAAELGVAKGVGGLGGGDVVAVGIDEAFAYDDEAGFFAFEDALDVVDKFLGAEGDLGEVDEVGGVVRVVAAFGEGGAGGDPAGVAAHDLDDLDEVVLAHGFVIAGDFADGGGDVFDDGAVAWAVVGDGEVVIDGFGDADDAKGVALFLGEFGDLVGSVLGIVAAGVEEVADIVGLKDFEDAFEVGLFFEFVAAGAEGGAGGVAEAADGLLGLGSEINEVFVEDAEDAVEAAVDFLDFAVVQGFGDYAGDAGIDDGGGASGLTHQNITYEFFGHGLWM